MYEENENKPQGGEEIEESIAAKRLSYFSPEIQEGDGAEAVIAREPGFLGWCKHVWYHYKLAIMAGVFVLIVAIICLRQCATRNSYDVDILYAGPWFECDGATSISGINEAFVGLIDDYDGDGQKNVAYTPLFLLSAEQLEALQKENESKPDEEKIYVSSKLLKDNRDLLDADIMTGEMSLCLLDPTIYWYMRENNLVDELSHYVDASLIPAGTNLEGYGIMLKDTAIGQYLGTFRDMPEDTILCVRRAGVMNQAWNGTGQEEMRARYADLLTELLSFQAPA